MKLKNVNNKQDCVNNESLVYFITTLQIRKEIRMALKNLPNDKRHKYIVGRHRGVRLNGETPKFVSRCVPKRLACVVGKLRVEQRAVVCSIGFGQLLDMKCNHLK